MIFVMPSKLRDTSFPHQTDLSSKVHRTPLLLSVRWGINLERKYSVVSHVVLKVIRKRCPTHVLNKRDHIIEVSREQMLH